MEIIDYNDKYYSEVFKLQEGVWGEGSDTDEIFYNLDNYKIKLTTLGEVLCGVVVFHKTQKSIFIDFIIIKPEFQKMGIGSLFMEYVESYAKANHYEKIECQAIDVNGVTNAKRLLEKFGFRRTYSRKNYWGKKLPNFYCKQCNSRPCTCTMHKYEKLLIK